METGLRIQAALDIAFLYQLKQPFCAATLSASEADNRQDDLFAYATSRCFQNAIDPRLDSLGKTSSFLYVAIIIRELETATVKRQNQIGHGEKPILLQGLSWLLHTDEDACNPLWVLKTLSGPETAVSGIAACIFN